MSEKPSRKAVGRFKTARRREKRTSCDVCDWAPPPGVAWLAMHAHHVIPLSRGGPDDEANLCLLCPNCHTIAHATLGASDVAPNTPRELVGDIRLLVSDYAAYRVQLDERAAMRHREHPLDRAYRIARRQTEEAFARRATSPATSRRFPSQITRA